MYTHHFIIVDKICFYFIPKQSYPTVFCDVLLFVHAATGYDTTLGVYNQGKIKCITTLKKNLDLRTTLKVFNLL